MGENLKDGWLADELAEAPSDMAMSFARYHAGRLGGTLSVGDAARLRAKMIERYREWTERDLVADLAPALPRNPMIEKGE